MKIFFVNALFLAGLVGCAHIPNSLVGNNQDAVSEKVTSKELGQRAVASNSNGLQVPRDSVTAKFVLNAYMKCGNNGKKVLIGSDASVLLSDDLPAEFPGGVRTPGVQSIEMYSLTNWDTNGTEINEKRVSLVGNRVYLTKGFKKPFLLGVVPNINSLECPKNQADFDGEDYGQIYEYKIQTNQKLRLSVKRRVASGCSQNKVSFVLNRNLLGKSYGRRIETSFQIKSAEGVFGPFKSTKVRRTEVDSLTYTPMSPKVMEAFCNKPFYGADFEPNGESWADSTSENYKELKVN